MRVGWVIPTVETFGSVREMIEVSNVLVGRGHEVTIYHPQGHTPTWLPSTAQFKKLSEIGNTQFDVMIGIVDWEPKLYDLVVQSNSKLKAICLMGFNPDDKKFPAILQGKIRPRDNADRIIRDAIVKEYLIFGDGGWQRDWMREKVGIEIGPPFGGINTRMFNTDKRTSTSTPPWQILYTGDGRERKGTDVVRRVIDRLSILTDIPFVPKSYYGKYVDQKKLVDFLSMGDIFVDNHRRAGWCNPVIEAMACGNAVVCTDIGATQDFAIDGETALVVGVDDAEAMINAVMVLTRFNGMRETLVKNGLEKVKEFDYEVVVPVFEQYLLERL